MAISIKFPVDFGESPAKLRITLKSGESFEHRRDYATGSKHVPMTQAQVEAKFNDCAAQTMNAEVARKILATLNTIAERRSFDDFWTLIRRA